jgi:hypothetical protein
MYTYLVFQNDWQANYLNIDKILNRLHRARILYKYQLMANCLSADECQVSTIDDMSTPIRSLKKVNTNG